MAPSNGGCFTVTTTPYNNGKATQKPSIVHEGKALEPQEKAGVHEAISMITMWEKNLRVKPPRCEKPVSELLTSMLNAGHICKEDQPPKSQVYGEFAALTAYPHSFMIPDKAPQTGACDILQGSGTPSIHIVARWIPRPLPPKPQQAPKKSQTPQYDDNEVARLAVMLLHEAWHFDVEADEYCACQDAWEVGAYSWCSCELPKVIYSSDTRVSAVCKEVVRCYVETCAKMTQNYVGDSRGK